MLRLCLLVLVTSTLVAVEGRSPQKMLGHFVDLLEQDRSADAYSFLLAGSAGISAAERVDLIDSHVGLARRFGALRRLAPICQVEITKGIEQHQVALVYERGGVYLTVDFIRNGRGWLVQSLQTTTDLMTLEAQRYDLPKRRSAP
jgi:hypothetical protein